MLDRFRQRGIAIESKPIEALVGPGADLSQVRLADGASLPLDALYIGPRQYLTSAIAEQIGCKLN